MGYGSGWLALLLNVPRCNVIMSQQELVAVGCWSKGTQKLVGFGSGVTVQKRFGRRAGHTNILRGKTIFN